MCPTSPKTKRKRGSQVKSKNGNFGTIIFDPDGIRVRVKPNTSIYEAARMNGIAIESICGGKGTCGKCRVLITKGGNFLTTLANSEKRFISDSEVQKGNRLACLAKVNSSAEIRVII
ncbi:MAG: 2Fe-2S iron-sulfur cluster binding domain-containing protein, partial [Candidatus Heimdallarchaeota archaeon]|nr:2Fe-2S iron-sulfur cluster binding domain-containing protein [Candidatus Heimdallarchaeota archaeon]